MFERGVDSETDEPSPTVGFVGRDEELARFSNLLLNPSVRLVTLIGGGGIGKTTMAAEGIRRFLKGPTPARVYWVWLDKLSGDSSVAKVEQATASAVIRTDFSGLDAWEALVRALKSADSPDQRTVLVLDNCEHVLGSVQAMIADLLQAVHGLTIVTTSREVINWVHESLIHVPPLSEAQAVRFFRQRAELIGRPVPAESTAIVSEICSHIHYNPLYIRLAAARLLRRPLGMVLAELTGQEDDKRMGWSNTPQVGAEQRHRKVTDVIGWSYQLCSAKERLLFERLSVFATGHDTNPVDSTEGAADVGADLDAIEAVCSDDIGTRDDETTLARDEIEELLDRLVDRSLVTMHMTTTVRYSLLESLRLFAGARLQQRSTGTVNERARLAIRHLRYYRDKVADAASRWYSPDERILVDWARAAWDNILVAIETSLTVPGEASAGLEICLGLINLRVPFVLGTMRDIRHWTQRCVDACHELSHPPTDLLVAARAADTWLLVRRGQSREADEGLKACVAEWMHVQGDQADWPGDPEIDIGLPARLELAWGTAMFMGKGRDNRSVTVLLRARDKFHDEGDAGGEMMSGMFAGLAAAIVGLPTAHAIARQCRDSAIESGAPWAQSWAELPWAVALMKGGNPVDATKVLHGTLRYQLEVRDAWGAMWSVELQTWAMGVRLKQMIVAKADRKQQTSIATEIAHLAGGLEQLREKLGINIEAMGFFADESRNAKGTALRVLGPGAYKAAQVRGTKLRLADNQVHQLALGTLTLSAAIITVPWDELTPTEEEVAVLAAAGCTNPEIASRRGRSLKTIDAQMASILQKLKISSREEIIRLVPRTAIGRVENAANSRPSPGPEGHSPHRASQE